PRSGPATAGNGWGLASRTHPGALNSQAPYSGPPRLARLSGALGAQFLGHADHLLVDEIRVLPLDRPGHTTLLMGQDEKAALGHLPVDVVGDLRRADRRAVQ